MISSSKCVRITTGLFFQNLDEYFVDFILSKSICRMSGSLSPFRRLVSFSKTDRMDEIVAVFSFFPMVKVNLAVTSKLLIEGSFEFSEKLIFQLNTALVTGNFRVRPSRFRVMLSAPKVLVVLAV